MMKAVDAFVHIDSNGSLQINTPLPLKEGNVKVIIMYSENEEMTEEQLRQGRYLIKRLISAYTLLTF